MNYYANELKALQKSNRYRTREVVDYSIIDFASNDYLGLASKKELHSLTCKQLANNPVHAPKASLLVNGYHKIHKDFEDALCEANDFEAGVVLGSGFNANIALIEALVRKDDMLFMDEKFHASGVLASNLGGLHVREELLKLGFAVGAIRQPTVPQAIMRIIARVDEDLATFEQLCIHLSRLLNAGR